MRPGGLLLCVVALAIAGHVDAQTPELKQPPPTVSPVEVVASSPLGGLAGNPDKLPLDARVLSSAELRRTGPASVLGALDRRLGAVSLSEAQANPFQPNLTYRGFEASPLGGNAQGLAVYLDGVRFNQPFGDTVNFDLIPDAAVKDLTVEGANPVFGLNALGGSIAVRLKDGFSDPGLETELRGGAFGRVQSSVQWGRSLGGTALYLAAEGLHEEGWRAHSPSTLRRLYADLGWRGELTELHARLVAADNALTGNGPAPVELRAADRSAVFTYPDRTLNRFGLASLTGRRELGAGAAVQGQVYLSRLDQRTLNADLAGAETCEDDPDAVCAENGAALTDPAGAPIPSTLEGPLGYTRLNRTSTRTTGYGGAVQVSGKPSLLGRPSRLLAGASFDGGQTLFAANSSLGGLRTDRSFAGPGMEIDAPDALVTPVSVNATNAYAGLFGSAAIDVTRSLTLTLSGRLNHASIALRDQRGSALNGDHRFTRFDPGVGATWRLSPQVTAYAGYAESNRAPTPAELSCADPLAPCSLTNFFVSDPALKQVVARTAEAGLRGRVQPRPGLSLKWRAGGFRTETADDLQFVASPTPGRAYFRNIGATRRQGFDGEIEFKAARLSGFLAYSHVEAAYRTALTRFSDANPQADASGQIRVQPGDRIPGVPANRVKFGFEWQATGPLGLGVTASAADGQVLVGDEANLTPKTRGYVVLGLSAAYQLTPSLQFYASIANLLDRDYETFGTFAETAEVRLTEAPGATDPRSLTPAAPRAIYAGVRFSL